MGLHSPSVPSNRAVARLEWVLGHRTARPWSESHVRERPISVILAIAALIGCGAPAATPEELEAAAKLVPQPDRIVAIGDLHADLDNAIAVLALAGVTDSKGHWTGGETVLVQTGDLTDRGPDSKAILELMRTLATEAEAAGGRVVSLIGNHEVMNIQGDWRYVDPKDVDAYGGVYERKEAFSLDGPDGAWIAQADVVARVGDAIFVHGGVTEEFAKLGVDGINTAARAEMRSAPTSAGVLGQTGPLWYRGFVEDPEPVACTGLRKSLATLEARRMVVGHTTRRDGRIEERCAGMLLVIDIGIADHYGANLGAVEIVGGDAKAIYPSGVVDIKDPV